MPDDTRLTDDDLRYLRRLVRKARRDALEEGRRLGRAEGREEVLRPLEVLGRLNGSAAHVIKAFDADPAPEPAPGDADPHAAIADALLALAEEGDLDGVGRLRDLLADPAELGRVLADGGADEGTVGKCVWAVLKGWDESKHPRGKGGHFISKDRIDTAKSDPELAAQLKEEVKPEDAGKLDAALEGKTDLGRTKRGQARHEAGERRRTREGVRDRVHALGSKVLLGESTPDDLYELADTLAAHGHLLTKDDLRNARVKLGAKFGAGKSPRHEQMVAALVAHAKRAGLEGRTGGEAEDMRQAVGAGEAKPEGRGPPAPAEHQAEFDDADVKNRIADGTTGVPGGVFAAVGVKYTPAHKEVVLRRGDVRGGRVYRWEEVHGGRWQEPVAAGPWVADPQDATAAGYRHAKTTLGAAAVSPELERAVNPPPPPPPPKQPHEMTAAEYAAANPAFNPDMPAHTVAESEYRGANKPWVARVTGPDKKFGVAQDFLGLARTARGQNAKRNRDDHEWDVTEPGVYRVGGTAHGGKTDAYFAVAPSGAGGVRKVAVTADEAKQYAAHLGRGKSVAEALAAVRPAAFGAYSRHEKDGPGDPAVAHRDAVRAALLLGKPVPPEVLKDYPDLAGKQPPAPPAPELAAKPNPPAKPATAATVGNNHAPTGVKRGRLARISLDQIEFPGGFSPDVTPLDDNADMPLIVKQIGDNRYRLIDGFGRASGLKNGGRPTAHAIVVSDSDLDLNQHGQGDDPAWVGAMHHKYAPKSTLAVHPRELARRKEREAQKYAAVDRYDGMDLKGAAYHLNVSVAKEDAGLLFRDDPATLSKYRTAIKRAMAKADVSNGLPLPAGVAAEFPDLVPPAKHFGDAPASPKPAAPEPAPAPAATPKPAPPKPTRDELDRAVLEKYFAHDDRGRALGHSPDVVAITAELMAERGLSREQVHDHLRDMRRRDILAFRIDNDPRFRGARSGDVLRNDHGEPVGWLGMNADQGRAARSQLADVAPKPVVTPAAKPVKPAKPKPVPKQPAAKPAATPPRPKWLSAHPEASAAYDAYEKASGRAKEVMANALESAGVLDYDEKTDSRRPAKEEPDHGIDQTVRHNLAARLAAGYADQHKLGHSPEEIGTVAAALRALGAEQVGEPGESVPFDGARHNGPPGVPTGHRVRVTRPGWAIGRPDGSGTQVLLKTETAKPAAKPAATGDEAEMDKDGAIAMVARSEAKKPPLDLSDAAALGAAATAAAARLHSWNLRPRDPANFLSHNVILADVYDALSPRLGGATFDQFKGAVESAFRAGGVDLAPVDMPTGSRHHLRRTRAGEILGAYHAVRVPPGPAKPASPNPPPDSVNTR